MSTSRAVHSTLLLKMPRLAMRWRGTRDQGPSRPVILLADASRHPALRVAIAHMHADPRGSRGEGANLHDKPDPRIGVRQPGGASTDRLLFKTKIYTTTEAREEFLRAT